MNKCPKISIVIPCFNRAERITKTILSALNQKYSSFEIIIVDDGSTDNTETVVASIKDDRINYFKKEHQERAIARNFGISKSTGDYITFLDSDDLLEPNCLSLANTLIKKHNEPNWLHVNYDVRDEKGNIVRNNRNWTGDINDTLLTGNHLSCIGVFVKKKILTQYSFNTEPEIIGSEDYILWIILAARFPLSYTNTVGAHIIQHSKRSVINMDIDQLQNRVIKSIEIITDDSGFKKRWEDKKFKFIAHRYLYLSLHLILMNEKKRGVQYLLKAFECDRKSFFKKKVLVIIREILLAQT